MKKNMFLSGLLFSVLALATSCAGDYDDWADPQHNDPESAVTLPGYTATAADAINLGNAGESVKAFSLSTAALPEGTSLQKTRMIITPTDEATATDAQTLETTVEGMVDSLALQDAVIAAYGRRPVARHFSAHVYSDVMVNGQAMLVDAGEVVLTVTPSAPHISAGYYLVGDFSGWSIDNNLKFSHSDKDVYEDPVFTLTFTTTGANQYWKIIPQENVDGGNIWADGVVGVATDGSTDAEGTLVIANPQAGKIVNASTYTLTLNMLDYTYSIEETSTYYMVGALPGWSADGAAGALFYPDENNTVSYTTQWTGDANLKIWDWNNLGNWDNAWGATTDGDNSVSGSLTNSGAGAIVCPGKGEYYKLTLDMGAKTYTWTRLDNQAPASYTSMGLIGDFNGWGGDLEMTQVTPHNWYVKATIPSTGGLKFRANGGWDVNWGGSYSTQGSMQYGVGVGGGDNLSIAAGTYRVYLNDITGQFAFIAE